MIIMIGLFFLYLDIYLSAVDIIPDAIGFFLITIAFFLSWRKKQCSFLWSLLSLITMVSSMLPWFSLNGWAWSLLLWFFPPVSSFFLVWRLYLLACCKASHVLHNPPAPDQILSYQPLVRITLIFILLCELCSPILSFFSFITYLLLILRTAAGIFMMVRMYKMLYWNTYC